jgi:hypothetical protein
MNIDRDKLGTYMGAMVFALPLMIIVLAVVFGID